MKIQTLKDLKVALKDVPDEILEDFGAGHLEENYVQLMIWGDRDDPQEDWDNNLEKYGNLKDIDNWIQNISKVTKMMVNDEHLDTTGFEEAISSEDKL